MKKNIVVSFVVLTWVLAFCGVGICEDVNKPTITVYGFENKASSNILHDANWDIGSGLGEMLVQSLLDSGRFNVVERLNLEDITFEQDLVTRGRVSKSTGAKTGKMIGAQYIVRGTLTEFDVLESDTGGGINIKGISVGLNHSEAHVGGTLRIYDATTGEIYASERFARNVPSTGISFGYNRGNIGGDIATFKKTPLGEATQLAINDIVEFIVTRVPMSVPKWMCSKCNMSNAGTVSYCSKCGASRPEEVLETCPVCGVDVNANMKFCSGCGTQLKDVKCSACGTQLKPGSKFCVSCGSTVGNTRVEKK